MIQEAIFSGFISKVINDITDVSKKKIINAVNNRNDKHQGLESQIYNVIIDILNEMTNDQYRENQNKIYDMAETLLISLKNSRGQDTDIIKSCFQDYGLYTTDKHIEFKRYLYHKLSKEDYKELYNEITFLWRDQQSEQSLRIERGVDKLNQKVDDLENNNEKDVVIQNSNKMFQNNKKHKYIDNWNSRLFLHQDNDEIPLTLEKAFIMPDFECRIEDEGLAELKNKTLEEIIEKIFLYNKSLYVLIEGVPGIGKTSIISWIANKYEKDERVIILRFRDWEKEELENGILKAICNTLKCKNMDLNNKILILDGFDEIKNLNSTKQLIDRFLNEILDIENVKIIITSRLNYIDSTHFQNKFRLLPFNIRKIKIFHLKITGMELNEEEIEYKDSDVLGIPVILYMAIMSNIDIRKKATRPELYSRIFAEKGGIFDRFSYKGIAYDEGSHLFRDRGNIRRYLKFLGEIAFMMFEKDDLYLSKEESKIPELEFQGDLVSILEFPIKYLFENTEFNIEFIHKSIYEYFVAEFILTEIDEVMHKDVLKKIASALGKLCKANSLSDEILEFLRYKIRNSKFNKKFDVLKDTFQLMLQNGMTYYTKKKYKNIIRCEMNIFSNMLEIIHLWEDYYLEFDNSINIYLQYNIKLNLIKTNLTKVDLEKVNLRESNLTEANLRGVNLRGANLENTDLRGAKLRGANLRGANLREANLGGADLENADLREANLREASLKNADLRGADLRGADLRKTNFKGANLTEENLIRVNFKGTNLEETILDEYQADCLKNKSNWSVKI